MNNLQVFARGGSGGRAGGGSRSSSSSKSSGSSSKSSGSSSGSSSKTSTPKTSTPKQGKSTAKAGSKIKTADGKEVQSSSKAPSNSKYTQSKGIVGDNGYSPRFTNGYAPPAGSVVYYQTHSALDYLPWVYLFSLGGDNPRDDQAIIVQPDNTEVSAPPVREGIDGMYVFNWVLLALIGAAIIGGVMWLVNKVTSK